MAEEPMEVNPSLLAPKPVFSPVEVNPGMKSSSQIPESSHQVQPNSGTSLTESTLSQVFLSLKKGKQKMTEPTIEEEPTLAKIVSSICSSIKKRKKNEIHSYSSFEDNSDP